MKSWKLSLAAGICLVALTACEGPNDITGTFSTTAAFPVVDHDGRSQSLPAGTAYKADLHMTEKGAAVVVNLGSLSSPVGVVAKVSFLLPAPLKDEIGSIAISAGDAKQSFSTSGEIAVASGMENKAHFESCIAGYDTHFGCSGDLFRGGILCETKPWPVWGAQSIEETYAVTDKTATLVFSNPDTQEEFARFTGKYRLASSFVTIANKGQCLAL